MTVIDADEQHRLMSALEADRKAAPILIEQIDAALAKRVTAAGGSTRALVGGEARDRDTRTGNFDRTPTSTHRGRAACAA